MACAMQDDGALAFCDPGGEVTLVLPGDAAAVHDGLQALFGTLLSRGLAPSDRDTAELVLAEVLNNIVEHAYARDGGLIEITLSRRPGELVCRVTDTGAPLPQGTLPEGRLPAADLSTLQLADLPEGGFGWFLIRSLSHDLSYQRENGQNRLSFRLQMTDPPT
jgi:serine/threonine-protein kinase RsbW